MLYKLQYNQVHKSWDNFFFSRRVVFFHQISRELECSSTLSAYLWLSLLISSLTYVEIMLYSIIVDLPRCIDNDSEVFVLESL